LCGPGTGGHRWNALFARTKMFESHLLTTKHCTVLMENTDGPKWCSYGMKIETEKSQRHVRTAISNRVRHRNYYDSRTLIWKRHLLVPCCTDRSLDA
jgi:hypothetical protein